MSEAPQQEVTLQQLQQEYGKLAQIFGDINYRISCFKEDADKIQAQMREVNQKAATLPKAEAPKEEPKVVEAEVV